MAISLKCRMCGGDLDIIEGESVAECLFCGSRQTVPQVDDEKLARLYARALRMLRDCEFDKAADAYSQVVSEDPEQAEAYWGLVLSRYGVEYVDDPAGGKVPTLHRCGFEGVMDDPDFELACDYADVAARRQYRDEAREIERLREAAMEASAGQEPYDVFICYKETDSVTGDRTLDSVIAQDVYDALTDRGYRVFFSRITLEGMLGSDYEPIIFAALNSAKVMLAFGTSFENYDAVWVKNEWSRFLKLVAKDPQGRHLVPCYRDLDPYDMPREFRKLQGQDMGKVGAIQDLVRGVEKIVGKKAPEPAAVNPVASLTEPLLKRSSLFLEDGDWKKATEYAERVLDLDPENGQAYLYKLMAKVKCGIVDALSQLSEPFDADPDCQKAIRFGDAALKTQLNSINKTIRDRIAQQEAERVAAEEARKKKEEERRASKSARAAAIRQLMAAPWSPLSLSIGGKNTVMVDASGKAHGFGDAGEKRALSAWRGVAEVSAGFQHVVALFDNGTVAAVGSDDCDQCQVSSWTDIVSVSAGAAHTVGLVGDGTVVACGLSDDGRCDVGEWGGIVAIAASEYGTVGLKSGGTVVACGSEFADSPFSDWKDISSISAGEGHIVGLKKDGTVVACGENKAGQCDVESWIDVVSISAGSSHTVGLKKDGTVLCCGDNAKGQCSLDGWKDLVVVEAGKSCTLAIDSDGNLLFAGKATSASKIFTEWLKPFDSDEELSSRAQMLAGERQAIVARACTEESKKARADIREKMLEEEAAREAEEARRLEESLRHREEVLRIQTEENRRKQEDRERARRRENLLCQHCGGQLKGLLSKKCVKCGKPKDY